MVVDAYEEPVLLAVHSERTFEVDLPQPVRRFGSEELPALMFTWIAVYAVPYQDIVYCLPG